MKLLRFIAKHYHVAIPAVPGRERSSNEKLKSVCVGRRVLSVRMTTHNSNEPLPSMTEVNISSNPTVMTKEACHNHHRSYWSM